MSARTPAKNHPWRSQIRENVYESNLKKRRDSIQESIRHLKRELDEVKSKLAAIGINR